MPYLSLETSPKEKTSGDSIAPGSIKLRHLSPELFLELQLIKLHNHLGTNSIKLGRGATPYVVGGPQPMERIEHGTVEWTGSSSAAGSIVLTFGNAFKNAPTVLVVAHNSTAAIICTVDSITASQVTLRWEDITPANHTSVNLEWFAIGR